MANISNRISYNRIKDVFDLGSTNTVKNFTEYLENSFLIFFVNQFSYSKGIQAASPKKVYCIQVVPIIVPSSELLNILII